MRDVRSLPGAEFTAPATCRIRSRQQLWPTLRSTPVTRNATRPKRRPEIQTFRSRNEGSRVDPLNLLIRPTHPHVVQASSQRELEDEPSLVPQFNLPEVSMFASDLMNRVSCLSKICFPHGVSKPFSRKNPADGRRNSTQT
jgi:hypothetical protein